MNFDPNSKDSVLERFKFTEFKISLNFENTEGNFINFQLEPQNTLLTLIMFIAIPSLS